MKWFIKCIKQYADFKGRARRQEFWMFTLFYCLASILVSMIFLPLFGSLLMLGLLVPSLAVNVRRLHDVGKSGLWILLYLIPIVGVIWMLVYTVTEGQSGENEYGPDPKQFGDLDNTQKPNQELKLS